MSTMRTFVVNRLGMSSLSKQHPSAESVFCAIGFSPAEAAKLEAKSALLDAINGTIERRELARGQAALLCNANLSEFGNILRGNMESATIDMLLRWLNALGRDVEIRVGPYMPRTKQGKLHVFSS